MLGITIASCLNDKPVNKRRLRTSHYGFDNGGGNKTKYEVTRDLILEACGMLPTQSERTDRG
jgi:hypothetical protein